MDEFNELKDLSESDPQKMVNGCLRLLEEVFPSLLSLTSSSLSAGEICSAS